MKRLQILVTPSEYVEWRAAARAEGFTVGTWVRLKVQGRLTETAPAPVGAQPLRVRIAAIVGASGPFHKKEIGRLAMSLGVTPAAIHSSLGSMVASKRLVREGDTYRRADNGK